MKFGAWICRFGRRDDAQEELKAAQEKGDAEAIERFSKRTVKVTKQHVEDCKRLLTLMGVPYVEVQAPETPCSLLCDQLITFALTNVGTCIGAWVALP